MPNHSLDGNLGEKTDLERTILDTARAIFETYGVRRANIEDVVTSNRSVEGWQSRLDSNHSRRCSATSIRI